jgi:hypothetical protein
VDLRDRLFKSIRPRNCANLPEAESSQQVLTAPLKAVAMAEAASQTNGGNSDASRGMPYYEKQRKELHESLQKRRQLERQLATLEDNVYKLETAYIEETQAGNIIKGFDTYVKNSNPSGSAIGGGRRKGPVPEDQRIFSRQAPIIVCSQAAHTWVEAN